MSTTPPAAKTKRLARREAIVAAALLLVALGVYARFAWNDALPSAAHSDVMFATQNARGFIDGLAEGRLYPRWLAEANRGHGAPTFVYYPPAAYYLVAAANLLTQDLLAALRLTGVLLALLSGVAFFVAARRWASPRAAAFAAALYVALPYHVLDLYERFALAEFAAFVWYPIVFACADRVLDGPSRRAWVALALSYAGLVFTHLVSGFMIAFVLVPYLGVRALRERCWSRLVPFGTAILLGLACSAIFLVPVVAERGLVQVEYASEVGRFDWRRNLLFRNEVAHGYSRATVKRVVERAVVAQALLTLGALGTLAWRRRLAGPAAVDSEAKSDTGLWSTATLAWTVTAVWTVALQTAVTWPLWAFAPELGSVQFPWRFAGFQALAAAVLVARAVSLPERSGSPWRELWVLPTAIGTLFALSLSVGIASDASFRFDRGQAEAPRARGLPVYFATPRGIADPLELVEVAPRFAPNVRLEARGRVEIGSWQPHERSLVYESEATGGLQIRTFAFPGWTAEVDGEPTPIAATGRWGSIRIEAPEGRHEVRLTFGATPLRQLGAGISAAAVAALLSAIFWRRRSSRAATAAARSTLVLAVLAALGCEAPEPSSTRHLVVLTLDTVRRDHLSVYGYERQTTPQLEAFARESVVFWNAIAQDTNTNPSHASMFTGQYPHVHGSRANGQLLRPDVATLASILQAQGFATGGFVSSAVLWASGSGLERGFDVYDDDFDRRRRTGVRTIESARTWLAALPDHQRHLLFVHLYDAHGPYRPPAMHADRFLSPEPHGRLPQVPRHMLTFDGAGRPFRALSQFVDQYDATLRHVDDLFGSLRRSIDLTDTAMIVLADHGETLGERYHGLDHGGQVFDEQIRIPFLVHAPGLAPQRVDALVETVDLLPTALDLLGVAAPATIGQTIQGRSLVPLFGGDTAASAASTARSAFSAARAVPGRHDDRGYSLDLNRRIQSVRSSDWKLIRYPGAQEDYLELYDLRADPGEKHNLAAEEPERLAEYTALLDGWSGADAAGETEQLDPAVRERLHELGYVDEAATQP